MLSGCASIIDGGEQQVTVVTASHAQPAPGQSCVLRNTRGMWTVVSPGTTKVRRADDALRVRCEAPGYAPRGTQVESGVNGMVFGNILIGGLVGYLIDRSSGAAFQYPEQIAIDMGEPVGGAMPVQSTWAATAPATYATYATYATNAPRAPVATPSSAVIQNLDGSAFVAGTRYIAPW
ncbi:putative uncharacterized protein [Caballeronia insecticola]|uniref:Uncharacterized protein n=2 Tax=Caballeronia insecticola TaxID=758793 RepID=R4WQL4_9BURK|nr:putative uncharacterized protein [Caballeronia insecticola]